MANPVSSDKGKRAAADQSRFSTIGDDMLLCRHLSDPIEEGCAMRGKGHVK